MINDWNEMRGKILEENDPDAWLEFVEEMINGTNKI